MSALLCANPSPLDWEYQWAPYDLPTYQLVLKQISPHDVILDIGAGDLRLTRQMTEIAHKVYALEINRAILDKGLASFSPLPANLIPICSDAQTFNFPHDLTCGVLLMRHCTHFQQYAQQLREVGCERLITNARWGMNVEVIDLQASRTPYANIAIGWYACWCGTVGFKAGSPEHLTPENEVIIHEVVNCPNCQQPADMELSL